MQPRTHVMVKSSKSFLQGRHSFWGRNSKTFQGLSRTLISFFQHSSHHVTQLVQHHNSTTISLRFNGHFPAGCELASTGMSPVWTLLKQDDGCGGDNWSYEMSQTVTTNKPTSNFLQVGCPSCRPNQQCQSTEGICYYGYYAALLPRRGPHIASHSVCLSVCLSVRPSRARMYFVYGCTFLREIIQNTKKTSVFAYGPASRMYFSARAEGRISYGHLGRTNSCYYFNIIMKKALGEMQTLRAGCSKVEPKIFTPPQTPSRERRMAKI